ncbi:putative transmembrane protein [Clostridium botulinum B str. Eklund 17B (NRP)]|nr:putative transmembrane protein [Clostridium botulinum B str. Eklund 17B (NRP)]
MILNGGYRMEKNNLYFLRIGLKNLIIVIPILCVLTFGIYKNIVEGNIQEGIFIIISIVFAIGFFYFKRNKSNEYINRGFQYETSKELLKYYDNVFSKHITNISDQDAWLTYSKCLVCCYYGEFDKAMQILNGINWSSKSPYIQSLELSIKALMCYLQSKDYKEGLRLSMLSQQLGHASNNISGNKKTQSFYESYILVGELLNGNIESNIIVSLEGKYNESPVLVKLLIGHCLSKVYIKMNMKEKAEEKIRFCKKIAPHCGPLFN